MTLLQALRSATQASHQQLDRQISTDEVTVGKESYVRYLERFYQGLVACWPQLDWTLLEKWELPELSARQARYHALTADLHSLGHTVAPLEMAHESGQAASTIGCLYVLEGSIHGGAILLAELEKNAGPLPANTCGFMRGFGDHNRSYWKDFVSWLESLNAGDDFMKLATATAVKAFENFSTAFGAESPTAAVR